MFNKYIWKLTVLFLLQAFLLLDTTLVGGSEIAKTSTLSPTIQINNQHLMENFKKLGNFATAPDNLIKNPQAIYGKIGFNPLQALKDPEILNVFQQVIERRYDVRVLVERYKLETVPRYLTYNGEKLSVSEYVKKMIDFLIYRADQEPHLVAKAFREAFPNMARPPELDQIFDEYMKIKIKEFDLEVLKDTIPPESIIADIGAGKNKLGRVILEYSDQNNLNVRRVIGTDIEDWTDSVGLQDDRLSFVLQKSGTRFPLSANTFDAIIVKWVLHHMSLEEQIKFLRSIHHILNPGGRIIIFESLGITPGILEEEIWQEFQHEIKNLNTWPRGSFYEANLKLTLDFMKLNSEQQLKVAALEDFFGHNLVMGRDWMPQPFTYHTVSDFQELLTKAGFTENKTLRRIYGSAPIMRMGPPSVRLVFEKNIIDPTLIAGDGGESKIMLLIQGLNRVEETNLKTVLTVLVDQDLLRTDMEDKLFDDVVVIGNERIDTFAEALELINSERGKRIVILGGFGKATIPLIDVAVKNGYKIEISKGITVNKENWESIKREISNENKRSVIQTSEAEIIRQIMIQMIETYPDVFSEVKNKISIEGLENVILTLGKSDITRRLFIQYRKLLDAEGAFNKRQGHNIVLIQNPYRQLRGKAAVNELLASELRQNKVNVISHTVSYENVEMPKISAVKELLGEIWRLIIHSDCGTGYINLRGEKYPMGINSIPIAFWKSANFLFNSLDDSAEHELAGELKGLMANEGLSIDEIIPKDNPYLKEFIENIYNASKIDFAIQIIREHIQIDLLAINQSI